MVTQLNLQAEAPGTLRGLSSHYSGEGFSDMHFQMQAVTAAEFSAWVERTRAQGPKLDSAAYAVLERQSINTPATAFGSIDDGLFRQVATQQRPQGPGPATEHSGEAQAPTEKH
jgi:cytochrome o ubiquinol oxidase subunit II